MNIGLHVGEKGEGSLKVAPIPKQRHRVSLTISHAVQNVAPTEADSVTSARARAWLVSFGSRQA
jgi:hypothetical protein